MDEHRDDRLRLDKWLWAARFFKTRALAAEAAGGGKVHVNGQRAKPACALQVGDVLEIRKGPYEFVVAVKRLSARRGGGAEAAQLYEETPESRAAREHLSEQRRLFNLAAPRPAKRPDKRQRRHIIRFTGKA